MEPTNNNKREEPRIKMRNQGEYGNHQDISITLTIDRRVQIDLNDFGFLFLSARLVGLLLVLVGGALVLFQQQLHIKPVFYVYFWVLTSHWVCHFCNGSNSAESVWTLLIENLIEIKVKRAKC